MAQTCAAKWLPAIAQVRLNVKVVLAVFFDSMKNRYFKYFCVIQDNGSLFKCTTSLSFPFSRGVSVIKLCDYSVSNFLICGDKHCFFVISDPLSLTSITHQCASPRGGSPVIDGSIGYSTVTGASPQGAAFIGYVKRISSFFGHCSFAFVHLSGCFSYHQFVLVIYSAGESF